MRKIYRNAFNYLCNKFDVDSKLTQAKRFKALEVNCNVDLLSITDYQNMFGVDTTFDGDTIKASLFRLNVNINHHGLIYALEQALKPIQSPNYNTRINVIHKAINKIALEIKEGTSTLNQIKQRAKKLHNKELKSLEKYNYSQTDFNETTFSIIRDFEKIILQQIKIVEPMKKTRKDYEEHLNNLSEGCYSWDEVKENYSHMVKRESTLYRYFKDGKLGTLTRLKDSIAFNTSYNTWCR